MLDLSDPTTQQVIERVKTLSDRLQQLNKEAAIYRNAGSPLAAESCDKEARDIRRELQRVAWAAQREDKSKCEKLLSPKAKPVPITAC